MRPHALHPGAIQGKEWIKFCHLATHACGQDADGPDVEGGRAELAAEEEAAPVDVRAHRLVVGGELVGVDAALGDARVVDVVVGLAVEALGEDAYLGIECAKIGPLDNGYN